ncbi:MAG: hypothetical protein ACRD2N_22260 [Vicinamibacterales bacterium]
MPIVNQDRREFLKAVAGVCSVAAFGPAAAVIATAQARADDLTTLSLVEASALIRARKVSPVDLTKACLARIDKLNPILNAFITVTADAAL